MFKFVESVTIGLLVFAAYSFVFEVKMFSDSRGDIIRPREGERLIYGITRFKRRTRGQRYHWNLREISEPRFISGLSRYSELLTLLGALFHHNLRKKELNYCREWEDYG